MDIHFNIKLEALSRESNRILIRFYSEFKVDLRISQAKVYYEPLRSDDCSIGYVVIILDDKCKYSIKSFSGFPKDISNYTSLNFIVKDKTNRQQFAVQVPLNGKAVVFTPMIYEGSIAPE